MLTVFTVVNFYFRLSPLYYTQIFLSESIVVLKVQNDFILTNMNTTLYSTL
jgi:hypothetical protein